MATPTDDRLDVDADLVDPGDVILVGRTRYTVVAARVVATFADIAEEDRRPIALDVRPTSRRNRKATRTLRYRRTDRIVLAD